MRRFCRCIGFVLSVEWGTLSHFLFGNVFIPIVLLFRYPTVLSASHKVSSLLLSSLVYSQTHHKSSISVLFSAKYGHIYVNLHWSHLGLLLQICCPNPTSNKFTSNQYFFGIHASSCSRVFSGVSAFAHCKRFAIRCT